MENRTYVPIVTCGTLSVTVGDRTIVLACVSVEEIANILERIAAACHISNPAVEAINDFLKGN